MQLGVVDPADPVADQVRALRAACEDLGFFRVPVAAVPAATVDAAWEAALEFFSLPDADKAPVGFPEPGYPYGWSPYRHETLAHSRGDRAARPDLKESFSVGPDCAGRFDRDRGDQAWIRSPSLWPAALPHLRPAFEAYHRALAGLAAELLSVMARALDLAPDHFAPLIDRPISSMRAIHYPAVDGARDDSDALRAGAHSDYGTLTILRTDSVAGLEVLDRDGTWQGVDADPATFVVNLGDSIAQWTNDRWPSTLHRVVPGTRTRHSMAFFHMANWDAVIECLPGCREPGEAPRHAPVQAGPWLMQKFQRTVSGAD